MTEAMHLEYGFTIDAVITGPSPRLNFSIIIPFTQCVTSCKVIAWFCATIDFPILRCFLLYSPTRKKISQTEVRHKIRTETREKEATLTEVCVLFTGKGN
jgi:hypothetical protein